MSPISDFVIGLIIPIWQYLSMRVRVYDPPVAMDPRGGYPPVMPFAAPHAQVPLAPPSVLWPHGVSPAAQSTM